MALPHEDEHRKGGEEEVVMYDKRLIRRRKLRNDINPRAGDLHELDTGMGTYKHGFLHMCQSSVFVFRSTLIHALQQLHNSFSIGRGCSSSREAAAWVRVFADACQLRSSLLQLCSQI